MNAVYKCSYCTKPKSAKQMRTDKSYPLGFRPNQCKACAVSRNKILKAKHEQTNPSL